MIAVATALTALRSSTSALVESLDPSIWTDDYVRGASLLPNWSRAHVLTHLARNADGISRALSGVLRNEIVPRYPQGTPGRNADIESGALRSSAEILGDVRDSAQRLDRVFAAVADAHAWDRPTEDRPAGFYAAARWREIEIHRVDAAGKYGAADWPSDFVGYLLPELVSGLAERTGRGVRITVSPTGSRCPELAGREWTVGTGELVEVRGPDWAVLAWLVGRPGAAGDMLSANPALGSWL
ncbi:MAG: maleylpyruvate isomerase family mycothiol-dependent enzyme [Actinomycetota bacterium]|nr:maleylpyruvate isomerase family mycothiol-dependent enzyme [Actinomycetota bacterium]